MLVLYQLFINNTNLRRAVKRVHNPSTKDLYAQSLRQESIRKPCVCCDVYKAEPVVETQKLEQQNCFSEPQSSKI